MKRLCILLITFSLCLPAELAAEDWFYAKRVDEFSDQETHIAMVRSIEERSLALARCLQEEEFDLIFSVGHFIGVGNKYPVRYRVDKQDSVQSDWIVSTRGDSVFASDFDKTHLARQMLHGDELLVEITDARGSAFTAHLPLQGAANTLGRVMDACSVAREGLKVEGIDVAVQKYISMLGPKNVVCHKQMLGELGYELTDFSSVKSTDFFRQTQQFMNDKLAECAGMDSRLKQAMYGCKRKEWLLDNIYPEASKKNEALVSSCGLTKLQH
ncbi:hypothetical protein [Aliamphritea ceti]|uniref:hypothetical protein n=1 Tax=Aliamphritea ceti TaxID=1524258 RepID=UPI0021C26539|nr:hypothetical protein [Aliamphritea ceti]